MLFRHHLRLPQPITPLYPPHELEKTVNKSDLIDYVAHETDLAKATVGRVLDAIYGAAAHALYREAGEITLPGIGKLKHTTRAARSGRNPATGATIQIPAKRVVTFSVAKALKDAVA